MVFEQTSESNPYNITKRQHYHMQAILKKFAVNDEIQITSKTGDNVHITDSLDQCFMGRRAWSEECETNVSHPIERKYLAQIRRIENSESICDHKAISQYHLLWNLRYYFSKNEVNDYDLYKNFPCSSLDKDAEELVESWGKMPIREGGKIAGRFKATLNIKQLLNSNENVYAGYKWQVIRSSGNSFISADCYGESLLMAASPSILLIGGKKHEVPIHQASNDEVKELNKKSKDCSNEFYFGSL